MTASENGLFGRKSIRNALKAWHNSQELGQHPLANLQLVAQRHQQEALRPADTPAGRGIVLRHVLREAVNWLRPSTAEADFSDPQWRYYTILNEQFINGRATALIQAELGISESGYFADQRAALDRVGEYLHEQELNLPPAGAVQTPTAHLAPRTPARLHNLPRQFSAFVGREEELATLHRLLQDPHCRLVTLIGPGGVGKTRLTIQAANTAAAFFPHGVYFAALAPLRSAEFLISTIADVLQLTFESQADPRQQLLDFLREKELLLILDNFEHLLEGAPILADILEAAPYVHLLVSSRARLQLRGEWVVPIEGLKYPASPLVAPDDFTTYSAVQLFLEAMQRAQAGLTLREADQPHVVRICELLGGLPLALELAASWVHMMPCADIAAEIERNLDFLASNLRDMPHRHRSLRAAFDHSWRLLTPAEQTAFSRLSVFRGPFHRDAAWQVAGATLTMLHALYSQSLLTVRPSGRYMVHELLRQYAAEHLERSPDLRQASYAAHCAYFSAFLRARTQGLKEGGRQKQTLEEIEKEIENIRTAWQWAVDEGAVTAVWDSAEPLYHFYEMQGRPQEGATAFEYVTQHLPDHTPEARRLLALAWGVQGRFRFLQGVRTHAQELLQRSLSILADYPDSWERAFISTLALEGDLNMRGAFDQEQLYASACVTFERLGDHWGLATAHFLRGAALHLSGHSETHTQAQSLIGRSLSLRQVIGDQWGVGICLNYLARIAYALGEYASAGRYAEQSLHTRQELADQYGLGSSFLSLGQVAAALGNYEEATGYYRRSLQIYKALGNQRRIADCLNSLGYVAFLAGDLAEASRGYQEAFVIATELGDQRRIAWSVLNLGDVQRSRGEYRQALALYERGLTLQQTEDPSGWGHVAALEKMGRLYLVMGQPDAARGYLIQVLHIAAQTKRYREAIDALLDLSQLAWQQGQRDAAARYLAFVLQHQAAARDTLDRARQLSADYAPLPASPPPTFDAILGELEQPS